MFKNINKSSGQVARTLLVLAIIVLIAIIIAYIVIRKGEKPLPPPPTNGGTPQPVYEEVIGNIKFIFQDAINKGKVFSGSQSRYPEWQKDLNTKEKFFEVVVGAQNIGKENIVANMWDIGDIIDNEGRRFVPLGEEVRNWLAEENPCGTLLKPGFSPTPCKKIYEVAEISEQLPLKIEVMVFDTPYSKDKKEVKTVDLFVTPE